MNILTQRLPGLPVGLLRMMFGLLWLQAAFQKAPWVINAQGQRFGWMSNWLWTETQHPTFGFYKAMLENVVLLHFTFFGYLSFVVELALGVSLLLGLLTVLSGIGGALWQGNIAIGSYAVPGEWGWIWPLLIATHLVFAFSHAGRSVGVDLFLYHWLSKDPQAKQALGGFYATGYKGPAAAGPVPSACRPGKQEGARPMRIVTIIPALDEEAAIGSVVRAISRELVHEVIVVDNGSRDSTAAVAQAAGATVIQEPQRGYGAAGSPAAHGGARAGQAPLPAGNLFIAITEEDPL